ncbi:MAG: hypothetical protein U0800_26600 [Isosphaeraceae bacterium]
MTVATRTKTRTRKKAERTEAQKQQARINGSRSRGPIAAEGKAKSCRNAVRHGFRSETIVAEEDRPQYEGLRNGCSSNCRGRPGPPTACSPATSRRP